MSGIFGSDKEKTEQSSTSSSVESITRQPRLNFNASANTGGRIKLTNAESNNPSVRTTISPQAVGATQTALGNSRGALGRIEETLAGLRSNVNDFVRARVDPLEASLASRRAQTERALSRRDVFGSLVTNEIREFDNNADQQLGNARALAANEAASSIAQFETLARGVSSDIAGAGQQLLQQDITALGLNLEALRLSSANQLATGGTRQTEGAATSTTDSGTGLLGRIAGIASAFVSPGD